MNPDKNLFLEIERHMSEDAEPSKYLNEIFGDKSECNYPFDMLIKLKRTQQSPKHHPEGNVWNHTMLVVNAAAIAKSKSRDARAFMWAALLHDIGKAETTKIRKNKITSYDHDKVGAELSKKFLHEFTDDNKFIDTVVALVRWHMQILYVVKDLSFTDIEKMKQQVDFNEIALLSLCDRLGRLNADRNKEENDIRMFLEKCKDK